MKFSVNSTDYFYARLRADPDTEFLLLSLFCLTDKEHLIELKLLLINTIIMVLQKRRDMFNFLPFNYHKVDTYFNISYHTFEYTFCLTFFL